MKKLITDKKKLETPNKLLNDNNISLKAKGLFVFLQNMPSDWSASRSKIMDHLKEGEDSIASAIKELKNHGYLTISMIKNDNGKFDGCNYSLNGSGERRSKKNTKDGNGVALTRKL